LRQRWEHHRDFIAATRRLHKVRVDGKLYKINEVFHVDRYRLHDT